jgi:hypothetical protein
MKRHRRESGFAMLLVFLLSACVAITLYIEIPRVAFEAERQRELLLVDRGNQFKRAIQVFVTDKTNNPTHRYPASIDEMESFNNHRYLRHRYVDPMTGKDEWRLVHINGGILTDSVTTQANPANAGAAGQSGSTMPATPEFISQQASLDTGAGGPAAGGVTRALRTRPGDTQTPGGPGASSDSNSLPGGSQGMPGNPGGSGANNGLPPLPGQPGSIPGIPPGLPGGPGMPGTSGASSSAQQPACDAFIGGCPSTTPSGQQPGQAGQVPSSIPGMPQSGGMNGPGYGLPGGPQGGQPNAQSAGANLISNLLTTPRPGGMPTGMPGSTVGGGIAGVASKYEAEGIMVINKRTKINEWEYIFDMSKYRVPPNPMSGPVGTQQPQMPGGPGGTPIGTPIGNNPPPPTAPQPGGGGGQ